MQVRFSGETVYDCSGESMYGVYKDLYKTVSERNDMVEYGIAKKNLRRLISGDDEGASSGNAQKVSDGLIISIYSKKTKKFV